MAVAKKYGQIQEERSNIPLSAEVVKYKNALKKEATNSQLWFDLGLAYAEQNLLREAEEAMSEAVSYAPFFAAAFVKKGAYQIGLGRYDEGAGDLSVATHLNPEDAEAWLLLGVALYLGREYQRAWRALEFAVRKGGDEARLWYALALLKAGKVEKSCKIAAEAENCSLCQILCGKQNVKDALEQAATKDDHDRVITVYVAAECLFAAGEREEAEKVLRGVVPHLDTCWWGFAEHAVRVTLEMDAAVRCVF